MPEHLIQLRRAWTGEFRQGTVQTRRRIDLPTTWPEGSPRPFRLSRAFQWPRLEPGASLRLRLESVPGLLVVRLDDQEIARPSAGTGVVEAALDGLARPRGLLALDVDPAQVGGADWGRVALVIRTGG